MKKTKYTPILYYIAVVGILASLLLCMTGCKKKPHTDPSDKLTSTSGFTDEPSTKATTPKQEDPKATEGNKATEETKSTDETGSTESTVSNCAHVPGNWIVDKVSTCTTEGSRHKACAVCKETVETESIPTINHAPGNWIIDKIATCTAEGSQHQECTQCKTKIITIAVAKAAHNEVTISGYAATTTKTGLTDGKKCTVCKEFTQPQYVIPAIGSAGFGYTVNSDNRTCTIISLGSSSDISVPSAISGYTVTGIGDDAFANQKTISRVILPSSITKIGSNAFSGCTGLTDITFQGTTAQWNAIAKDAGWDANTGSYTIRCSNGSIAKKG